MSASGLSGPLVYLGPLVWSSKQFGSLLFGTDGIAESNK